MFPDDPDKMAELFYFVLLGGAVSVWLFGSYKGKLNLALQQAAIWVLIFIFAVIGYGFRDQLGFELYPRQASITQNGEIVLQRRTDGHFYAPMTVNGIQVTFLVDTGATKIVLPKEVAQDLGIRVSTLSFVGRSLTANGEVRTANILLDKMEFGTFKDHAIRATVTEGDLSEPLLGMSYLKRFKSIEIAGSRMILRR